jgi:hypothetical protein
MPFQSSVAFKAGFGVQGELYDDSAVRAEPFLLNSANAAYNIIGATAYSVVSEGVAAAGNTGTQIFAGILANPKNHALRGIAGNPLAPSLVLPNGVEASLVNMGCMVVLLPLPNAPGQINIGDLVIFDNTTGALSTIAPAVALPVGKSPAYAVVDRYTPNLATGVGQFGLAVIRITTTPKIPA